ncbi:glycerol-3-phosphate 1-O-acyltransferase PlsY [Methylophaga frappieri]|nr:glycerol-3-phosphate 1-O-acyltransferase PlsY [Methylophaga frappieri]
MPEISFLILLVFIGAYLIGSLSSAVMLCRLTGLPDPRTQGSGNPGATNVLRMGSKKAGCGCLANRYTEGRDSGLNCPLAGTGYVLCQLNGVGGFSGALISGFFQFRGGKGVATALGAFLALSPWLALAAVATWLAVFMLSRISSLSAISAAMMTPIYSLWLIADPASRGIILLMALLLLVRHHGNIRRLLHGEEKKSG